VFGKTSFSYGVNQRRTAELLGVSQSGVSKSLKRFNQRESCENERNKKKRLGTRNQKTKEKKNQTNKQNERKQITIF
jgi:predicted transcriptional regulator